MRQLVSHHAAAFASSLRVLTSAEHHVLTNGVSQRVYRFRRLRRGRIGMDSYCTEIVTEPVLEVSARRRTERPPTRTDHVVHDRWNGLICLRSSRRALKITRT
jgi:hypothetical protein